MNRLNDMPNFSSHSVWMHVVFDVHGGVLLAEVYDVLWCVYSNVIGCASVFNVCGCRLYVCDECVCNVSYVFVCMCDADAVLSSLLSGLICLFGMCVSPIYMICCDFLRRVYVCVIVVTHSGG